jgi:UDP-N-acetylmuramate dehydrogenase
MSSELEIRDDVPLAPMTTFGVGGPARHFVEARSLESLVTSLAWARKHGVPATVLGGGSNVVVSDRGVHGLVVRIAIDGIRTLEANRHRVLLQVGAGESLDGLVAHCVAAGWAGLECLSGIPGYVGATPIQNVGAYGQEIGERTVEVSAMEKSTGNVVRFDAAACRFSYRSSIFKGELRDAYIVLGVTLALDPAGAPTIRYPELARALEPKGSQAASLGEVRETVLAIRRSKSMVIDAADPNHRSAGSFFVNPVVSAERAAAVAEAAGTEAGPMPRFEVPGGVKLSAAWLIERAGFTKGTSDGRVGISTRHALAIVNRGGASARELLAFAAKVRAAVNARFRVTLAHEPVFLGFDPEEVEALEGETV